MNLLEMEANVFEHHLRVEIVTNKSSLLQPVSKSKGILHGMIVICLSILKTEQSVLKRSVTIERTF